MPPTFRIRFDLEDVPALAARYEQGRSPRHRTLEARLLEKIGPRVARFGHMTTDDLLTVSEWKSRGRNLHLVRKNPESRVRDVTRLALIAEDESARLDVPTLLHGVGHRVASVILHFCHADPYPILDFRALRSLGVDDAPDPCPFDFWWTYVQECRMLSAHGDLSMRELDRALRQYDRDNP